VKVQILHLDATDDHVSTRDKLGWIQAPRVLLVWPRRGRVLNSRLDLKLVARAADRRGTRLGLVTHDPDVRDQARSLGIPVFDSVDDLPEDRWRTAGNGKAVRAPSRDKPFDLNQLRLARHPEVAAPSIRSRLGRGAAFALAILAVLVLLILIVPSADIVLVPRTERQSLALSFVLDADPNTSNSEGHLPARILETTISGELRTPTTGRALAPSSVAIGSVVFTNLTSESISLPTGTGVRPSGPDAPIRFTTLEPVTLEAEEGAEANAGIQAVNPGPSGNLAAGLLDAVEGEIGLQVSVTNPEATRGGGSGPQPGVSARDASDLELEVRQLLIRQAEGALADQLGDDEVLAPASMTLSQVIEKDFDHEVGEPAESLSLSMRASVTGRAYSRSDIVALAQGSLDADLPEGEQAVPGSLSYEEASPSQTASSTPVTIRVHAWREVFSLLDTARAGRLVRGLDRAGAIAILARQFELGGLPRIRLRPAWWPRLPLLEIRIGVHWPWQTLG